MLYGIRVGVRDHSTDGESYTAEDRANELNASYRLGIIAAAWCRSTTLIPVDQVDKAFELLRRAGHRVIG
ncbi:hypothetical protein [Tenggerimyces flavus]|uniref:Uncharacterized protein n=1 Tax=Tenggerimyces flavus TaxID=1708749 RepID=A0ABV7Y4H0_9ACTN|nr:hypothetical protein [Tenggerimyces flavus]MBM7790328.1 hypothetical protein [Tenggerimyces flavus]